MLSPVKEGITPFPEDCKPILVLEFVQSNVTPETELVSWIGCVVSPAQIGAIELLVTVKQGCAKILVVIGVPEQPNNSGVTVNVAVWSTEVGLTTVNAVIAPEPEFPKPMFGLSFVQL